MKIRSIVAILTCLLSVAMLPIANNSFSILVFVSPALLALIGFVSAIMAILNKKENRKLAKLAVVINLCSILGYLLFVIYMGLFWQL